MISLCSILIKQFNKPPVHQEVIWNTVPTADAQWPARAELNWELGTGEWSGAVPYECYNASNNAMMKRIPMRARIALELTHSV